MGQHWGYNARTEGLTLIEGERNRTPVLSDSYAILCPLNSTFSCRHYPLMPVNRYELVLRKMGMLEPDE